MYSVKEIENRVFQGNALEVLKEFPPDCVDTVITSPPYYCFDEDTEVLTIVGWKNIGSIKLGDMALTVNPDNFELEYQNVEAVFKYYYEGRLFHFKGENIDLKVTPNHSLFVKPYHLKTRDKIGRWTSNKLSPSFLFRKAEDIKKNNRIPLRNFVWRGRTIDSFLIGEYKIPIEIWLEFFGWWISEGSVDGSCGGENRGRVGIKQKIYWKEVKLLLEKLPFKYKIYGYDFEIHYRPLHDYLMQFGNSHTKFIPSEIKSLEARLLEIFWRSYMKGDGHKLKSSYSVSKRLNDDLQEIAIKLGLNSKIVGNMIHYKRDNFVRPIDFLTKIEYEGYVYGISVKNHTLITRRNGTPIVSGNSQRFYGKEINTSWDGNKECVHEWDVYTRPGNTWSVPGPGLYGGKGTYNKAWVKPQEQAFCRKCGAWYGQLGLEPTPMLYIKHLVDIFREVKRVLKPTGIFFLNIGDTYAGSQSGYGTKFPNPKSIQSLFTGQVAASVIRPPAFTSIGTEPWIKPKQLMLIPSRTAIALCDDGWILRKDIIWKKKSCLPSQVKDNFNSTYEHIFMFVKEGQYFFNIDKARKPYAPSSLMRFNYGQSVLGTDPSGAKCTGATKGKVPQVLLDPNPIGAVKGDVWEMNTAQFKGAHFACFSEELVENCIRPGCSREVCSKCGKPKLEVYKMVKRNFDDLPEAEKKKWYKIEKLPDTTDEFREKMKVKLLRRKESQGWFPTCKCNEPFVPGIVLDPFAGAGTSLVVAKRLGYRYVGIEMQAKYIKMIENRLRSMLP